MTGPYSPQVRLLDSWERDPTLSPWLDVRYLSLGGYMPRSVRREFERVMGNRGSTLRAALTSSALTLRELGSIRDAMDTLMYALPSADLPVHALKPAPPLDLADPLERYRTGPNASLLDFPVTAVTFAPTTPATPTIGAFFDQLAGRPKLGDARSEILAWLDQRAVVRRTSPSIVPDLHQVPQPHKADSPGARLVAHLEAGCAALAPLGAQPIYDRGVRHVSIAPEGLVVHTNVPGLPQVVVPFANGTLDLGPVLALPDRDLAFTVLRQIGTIAAARRNVEFSEKLLRSAQRSDPALYFSAFDELFDTAPTDRLGWWLHTAVGRMERYQLDVRVLKPLKDGGLSFVSGRVKVDPLLLASDVDLAAYRRLTQVRTSVHGSLAEVVAMLVGHPHVYTSAKPGDPVPVRRAQLTVGVAEDVATGRWALMPHVDGTPEPTLTATLLGGEDPPAHGFVVRPGSILVFDIPLIVPRALRAAGPASATIAKELVPALSARLLRLAERVPVTLASDAWGEPIPGDPRPLVRMEGNPKELGVSLFVRPLEGLPAFVPGEGPERLPTVREGVAVHHARGLADEVTRATELATTLQLPEAARTGPHAFRLTDTPKILDVVRALRELGDAVRTEWRGEAIRTARPVRSADLKLDLRRTKDWFQVQGSAEVDGQGLDLAALLDAVEEGAGFVTLGDGSLATIESALNVSLGKVSRLRTGHGKVELGAVHAPLIDELLDAGLALETPADWTALADRIEAANARTPTLPGPLAEVLRPYQRDGFTWLARLGGWAPGGVLADDMGLGKTLQTLALLVDRSEGGPALVVAPTSVVDAWRAEATRFAPSLRVTVRRGESRRARDAQPGAGEIIVTSYDLLVRDLETLGKVAWHTVVFDEAHALKNPTTQRAKAACALQASFRVGLTGTPVENHVSDLWSLFRAVVPGLLPSWDRFRRAFATPIEEERSEDARRALAAIVRPFLLRRTKGEVAKELPSRTEITLDVQLSHDERVLYEKARLGALHGLGTPEETGHRFKVLAALTRLRQLACHPRLVDGGSTVPSSKLAALEERLVDLRDEGHAALVFSQFTSHLDLVQERLVASGFRVLRLDGSTPGADRARLVADFQAGGVDVFLISLKAGGTGLTLTRATYVFHLDPWWNPAAEDQATDRAHRIGQDKPVTVYRLVAQGTIESAILALHGEKRALAASLLEGTDVPKAYDTEALLRLLAGDTSEAPVEAAEAAPARPQPAPPAPARPPNDLATAYLAWFDTIAPGRWAPSSAKAYRTAAVKLLAWLRSGADTPTAQRDRLVALRERPADFPDAPTWSTITRTAAGQLADWLVAQSSGAPPAP